MTRLCDVLNETGKMVYSMPYLHVIIVIIGSVFVWGILSFAFYRNRHDGSQRSTKGRKKLKRRRIAGRLWRGVNILFFLLSLATVAALTITNREAGGQSKYLIPFYSFFEARENPEFYRTLLMNIFLFVPFGLSFPYVLKRSSGHKRLRTVLLACCLSIVIESTQFFLGIGRAETDDVIMNTIGAFIGVLGFWA